MPLYYLGWRVTEDERFEAPEKRGYLGDATMA
jgi:hypothetical protein